VGKESTCCLIKGEGKEEQVLSAKHPRNILRELCPADLLRWYYALCEWDSQLECLDWPLKNRVFLQRAKSKKGKYETGRRRPSWVSGTCTQPPMYALTVLPSASAPWIHCPCGESGMDGLLPVVKPKSGKVEVTRPRR